MVCHLKNLTLLVIVVVLLLSERGVALPEDFEITPFVGGLRDPATMAFAPDGRLMVAERITGKLRVITASGQVLPVPFLTLDVPPVRHRSGGLRGFAFDPAFPVQPYIYIFYTKQFVGSVRHNRVSRFSVSASDPNLADPASEVVLLELPFNSSALGSSGSHNGGAVIFGGDGKLYITTGDGWDASNGYGAGDNVQRLSSYTGKIFRMNADGSIPVDNPFYAQASGDFRAIYALGFRNPYSAAVHPVTGEVFVFDVGTANGGNKDHVFKVTAGANYGHDVYNGIGTEEGTWAKIGTSIASGGAWYFSDQFPPSYHGRLFVTAWKKGLKTVASVDDATVVEFASGEVGDQGPVYPCVGPDGSLYYLESTYETSDGKIFKLSYTNVNRAPTPTFSPNGGRFVDSVDVAISGNAVRYTTDGSEPDAGSALYVGAIQLAGSATVKARSFESGFDPSATASVVFDVQASAPPLLTNTIPPSAQLSEPFVHTATSTGVPAATFSLDEAPAGMSVNAVSGEFFWIPDTSGDVTVVLRASSGQSPDAVQSVTVTVGNFLRAADPDAGKLSPGGLRYSYFESGPQAVATGMVATPNLSVRQRDDYFRIHFEGFLEVAAAGNYELLPVSSDYAAISVGGTDVTGQIVGLAAGLHAIVLEYREIDGAQDLELRWRGDSLVEEVVPSGALHHFKVPYGMFSRRLVPAYLGTFPPTEIGDLPALLSVTGAFANLAELEVVAGFVPYEPNAKLWSDGADKLRWIAVPAGVAITFSETGSWSYPAGTVLIKHFEIGVERRRIETRFEIIKPAGGSYLVTYRWREDQSDADLVPAAGDSGQVSFDGKQQRWDFPSRAQCVACHNSSAGYVLGASTRQLNGDYLFPSGHTDNQLRTWSQLGLLVAAPAENSLGTLDSLSSVTDGSQSLEQRARSYLDSNCAYCHNPNAAPEGTDFVLDFDTPLSATRLIGGLANDDLGLGEVARVIAPRDPRHSVLFQRLAGNELATRMPPVGRSIVHAEARDLLVEWILSLDAANTVVDVTDYSRRWRFDGAIEDGAWRDTATVPSYAVGQVGQALSFDGVDDAVDLGPLDVSEGDGLTITFWFKADDFGTSDARFLSKADGQLDDDHYWMVSTLNSTKLRFRLRAGGETSNLVTASNTISAGVWTHVAVRYDGEIEEVMEIYKDGVLVASQTKTGVLDSSGTVDAAIGNQPTTAAGGGRPFHGLIDDMRIYPRALDVAEIVTVRDAGGSLNAAPMVQIDPLAGTVGAGNFITRADAANLSASATDAEDGDLAAGVTWLSTTAGDVDPATLPDGSHALIATVRDANGSADSSLLRLNVVPGFAGWAGDFGVQVSPLLDQDGDGMTLLEEYAFGLSPDLVEPVPVSASFDEVLAGLTILFPANPMAIDLRYRVQFGSDLSSFLTEKEWVSLGDGFSDGGELIELGTELEVASSGADEPRLFGRVQVELAE
ncbi:MAG: putative repeat protein (TIGR03806 family) [Verrucomicrobiales bacterium]|jgi:uncharacterized repeat protein (TIGR03806 family)